MKKPKVENLVTLSLQADGYNTFEILNPSFVCLFTCLTVRLNTPHILAPIEITVWGISTTKPSPCVNVSHSVYSIPVMRNTLHHFAFGQKFMRRSYTKNDAKICK
jgi:hypothetical protein